MKRRFEVHFGKICSEAVLRQLEHAQMTQSMEIISTVKFSDDPATPTSAMDRIVDRVGEECGVVDNAIADVLFETMR